MHPRWICAILCCIFVYFNANLHRHAPGDDLNSSYIACRLISEGKYDHLYAHHQWAYHMVADPVWNDVAKRANDPIFLHPYVQAPLWAYALQPLCTTMAYYPFNMLFMKLSFAAMAAAIWLVCFMWAPRILQHPLWFGTVLAVFTCTTITGYMASLNQTHTLLLFATMLAIFLADRQKAVPAGLALAVAATIKVTPAVVAVYWLINRQYKSLASFGVWMLLLVAASVLAMGVGVHMDYLANIQRISNVLLLAYNNQSIDTWLEDLTNRFPGNEVFDWRMYPLPLFSRVVSYGFIALSCLFVFKLYKEHPDKTRLFHPYAVTLLMLTTMMGMNIAWNHYYIILVIPALILLQHGLQYRQAWVFWCVGLIVALNFQPISVNSFGPQLGGTTILRSQLLAGMIAAGSMVWCMAGFILDKPARQRT